MSDELDVISKALDSKIVEKAYDDGVAQLMKEAGKLGVDVVKTLRLFTAPLQVAAAYQDRLGRFLEQLNERVPESRRIEVPPQIGGPALQAMRYIDESDALWGMFTELLCKAADAQSVGLVHPAFIHILQQLTRDEAYLLALLKQGSFRVKDRLPIIDSGMRYGDATVVETTIPYNDLHKPDSFNIYFAHLESLSLVHWPVVNQTPVYHAHGAQSATERESILQLTEFGKLFVDACTAVDSSPA